MPCLSMEEINVLPYVSLLPPSSSKFTTLAPHFRDLNDVFVIQVAADTYGSLWENNPNLHGPLLLGLASIVYHREFLLKEYCSEGGQSNLQALALFSDATMSHLAARVTVDPTPSMPQATGVPPVVQLMLQNETSHKELFYKFASLEHTMSQDVLERTIGSVIERSSESDYAARGIITAQSLETIIKTNFKEFAESLGESLGAVEVSNPTVSNVVPATSATTMQNVQTSEWTRFEHQCWAHVDRIEKMYDTPHDFRIGESCNLYTLFLLWFNGEQTSKVRPYRYLNIRSFGPTVRQLKACGIDFKLANHEQYARYSSNLTNLNIMKSFMSMAEVLLLPELFANTTTFPFSTEYLQQAHSTFVIHLQNNFIEYAFKSSRNAQFMYKSFAQWLKPSEIKVKGTEQDCVNLANRMKAVSGFNRTFLTDQQEAKLVELEQGKPVKRTRHN